MSLLETIEYNDPLLTWKISTKNEIDLKSIHILTPATTGPSSELISIENHSLKQRIVHPLQSVEMISTLSATSNSAESELRKIPQHTEQIQPVRKKQKSLNKVKIRKRHKVPVDGMIFHSQQLGLKIPPKKTLGIKGMVIHGQAREVIHNVYKFMKEEAQNGTLIPISNYRERVLAATGISKCTYSKITSKEFFHGRSSSFKRKKKMGVEVRVSESNRDAEHSDNDNLCRPKINRDASTRDRVYNLEDVVPSYVLHTLMPVASNILLSNSTEMRLSPFVMESISRIITSQMLDNDKIRSITIFLYIHFLIRFINTPMKNVTKKFVVCEKSQEVNQHILDNFSVISPGGRTRPLHMKDKCLCYIIVLTAIANEYEVNVTSLSKDLKIGIKKAMEISRILAFNASMKNKNVVTLNFPLPPPVTFTIKKKRK